MNRRVIKDNSDQNILGTKQHLRKSYKISIHNRSNEQEQIEIRETIPISKNDAIKVQLDTTRSTQSYNLNDYTGLITWDISLDANQKEGVDLVYEIVLPADWTVN